MYQIKIYMNPGGRCPFSEWFNKLSDKKIQAVIDVKLERIRLGNFGQSKSLGDGIYELKVDMGPGYRLYFSKIGKKNYFTFMCWR